MKILISGVAGFLGSAAARVLLVNGHDVYGVDNLFTGRASNLEPLFSFPNFNFFRSSASDHSFLRDVVGEFNVDVFLSMATVPLESSLKAPVFSSQEIWSLGLAAAEVSRANPGMKLVHVSSSEVFGDCRSGSLTERSERNPKTPYAAAKAAVDHLISSYRQSFGINSVVFRPFNAFGLRQNDSDFSALIPRTLRKLQAGEEILVTGDGSQTRDFVSVDSICLGLLALVETQSKSPEPEYNFGSGVEVSALQVVHWILDACAKPDHPIRFVASRAGDVIRHKGGHELFLRDFGVSASPLDYMRISDLVSGRQNSD